MLRAIARREVRDDERAKTTTTTTTTATRSECGTERGLVVCPARRA